MAPLADRHAEQETVDDQVSCWLLFYSFLPHLVFTLSNLSILLNYHFLFTGR